MLNGFYFLSKSNIKNGKIDKKEINDISHQYSLLFEQSNKKMFKLRWNEKLGTCYVAKSRKVHSLSDKVWKSSVENHHLKS